MEKSNKRNKKKETKVANIIDYVELENELVKNNKNKRHHKPKHKKAGRR